MCRDEARRAAQMHEAGKSIKEIKMTIDAEFGAS